MGREVPTHQRTPPTAATSWGDPPQGGQFPQQHRAQPSNSQFVSSGSEAPVTRGIQADSRRQTACATLVGRGQHWVTFHVSFESDAWVHVRPEDREGAHSPAPVHSLPDRILWSQVKRTPIPFNTSF